MDIQSLRVRLTDDDMARLLSLISEDDLPAREVKAHLTAEGVVVEGKYPTVMLAVPFRMVWRLDMVEGKVRAQLARLDFHGMPAGPFRGMILGLIHQELSRTPGLTLQGETILLDPGVLLSSFGLPVTIRPTAVHHEAGGLVFVV